MANYTRAVCWLITAFVILAPSLFAESPSFSSVLFSVSCDAEPDKWSNWTRCAWPHGNLSTTVMRFIRDANNSGCLIPPIKLIQRGMRLLRTYANNLHLHPLYKRIPHESDCGYCGRQAQCCRRAQSFLTQSFRARICDGSGDGGACVMEPLNETDLSVLREWYPTVTEDPTDGCNVSMYVDAELRLLQGGVAYRYVEPLLCQILGSKRPTVNCKRVDDKCQCCCTGYEYSVESGKCQPMIAADNATVTCA